MPSFRGRKPGARRDDAARDAALGRHPPLFATRGLCYGSTVMKSARPIALWLAAVIVTIAAALLPSGAHAHGAQGHDAREHAAHGQVQPAVAAAAADATVVPSVAADIRPAGALSSFRTQRAPAVAASRMACACPACLAGAGCGHSSSSCCATGLAPSAIPGLIPPTARDRASIHDGPRLSGIVPEAQSEPPRPSA